MRTYLTAAALLAMPAWAAGPSGPYPAMHGTDPGLPGYVVFRPADLSPFGGALTLPVIGWVNGGCRREGTYASFLDEVASHGYVVVAPGGLAPEPGAASAGQQATAPAAAAAAAAAAARKPTASERLARIAPPETTVAQLTEGVDRMLARGAGAGSHAGKQVNYAGKLDLRGYALMGHSCGGMQALEASADPRVRTTVVLASGYWRLGGDLPGIGLTRRHLQQLHAPVAYLYGGAGDIVQVNAEADFVEIDQVPIFKAYRDAGHGLTLRAPQGGVYGKAVVDWLQWQLRGDAGAAASFEGGDCRLCADPAWTVEKKKIR